MVVKIQPHDIGTIMYNVRTSSLAKLAKKRWRRAYFTIRFSNTLASLAKNISLINPQVVFPEVRINIKEVHDHQFYDICQIELVNIMQNKDLVTLHKFDGVKGLAKTLGTDLVNGNTGHDLNKRRVVFGSNTYQKQPPKGLFYFMVHAFKDITSLILMGCAALSLSFGIKEDGTKDGWYEGGSIVLTVFLVIVVSAITNFRQEKRFHSLPTIKNNIKIAVFREGRRQKISIIDIVVGDIVVLNVGDQIPADGLFIDGHSLLVDEWSMPDHDQSEPIDVNGITNPFLFSGAKVADGHCRMLVLSVGMTTAWGKMMSSITDDDNDQMPLQSRLRKLTSSIGKRCLALTFLVLIVMLILDSVTGTFSAEVTIVMVAMPEGLPLIITLTFAYSMKRLIGDQAMVWKLSACETMGTSTIICTKEGQTSQEVTEGDDFTTKAITVECEIRESGNVECEEEKEEEEGAQFLSFTYEERMQKVDKIRTGTNDTPALALEEVDIELSMEIQGTEVATQSSDISISDNDNASVPAILKWGRCVFHSVRKFVHFQVTINFAALVINLTTSKTSGGVPLTAVQLLWVNLIMDTLGGLAAEGPTKELLAKMPVAVGQVKPRVTNILWRCLFAQAVFQVTVLLTFHFKGKAIFNVDEKVKNTIIFITFVLCQVFNEFNSRKILKKRNIFKGMYKNTLFVAIIGITVILEIVMVKYFKNYTKAKRSNGVQWGISIAIATISWLSQKEDVWNSEDDFNTTVVESMKKRTEKTESECAQLREEQSRLVAKLRFYECGQETPGQR